MQKTGQKPETNAIHNGVNKMITLQKQYADKNTYKHAFQKPKKNTDDKDGYAPHKRIVKQKENDWQYQAKQFDGLAGHDNEAEILALMNTDYRAEDLPSNGAGSQPDDSTSVIDRDNMLVDSNKFFIRRLTRWTNGAYNPNTKGAVQFAKRVIAERRKCAGTPAYQKRMLDKWLAM